MAPMVHLMPRVKDKLITTDLEVRVQRELGRVFPQAKLVTVHDLVEGFTRDRLRKMVLAVEVQTLAPRRPAQRDSGSAEFQTHVVKLGARDEVAADVRGWQECARHRPVAQRMFVPVELHDLGGMPNPRAAAVYQDASQWYGMLTPQEEEVATLGWAITNSVLRTDVCLESVERVIRQVLRELGRCFYAAAKDSRRQAETFYRRKLKLPDDQQKAVQRWRTGTLWEFRRDVVWLLCGQHAPDCPAPPDYHDPYDFVLWALKKRRVPSGAAPLALRRFFLGLRHAFYAIETGRHLFQRRTEPTGFGHRPHQRLGEVVRIQDTTPRDAQAERGDGPAEFQCIIGRQVESVVDEIETREACSRQLRHVFGDDAGRPEPDARALDSGRGAVRAVERATSSRLHGNPQVRVCGIGTRPKAFVGQGESVQVLHKSPFALQTTTCHIDAVKPAEGFACLKSCQHRRDRYRHPPGLGMWQ
jgi:hypothetical protein